MSRVLLTVPRAPCDWFIFRWFCQYTTSACTTILKWIDYGLYKNVFWFIQGLYSVYSRMNVTLHISAAFEYYNVADESGPGESSFLVETFQNAMLQQTAADRTTSKPLGIAKMRMEGPPASVTTAGAFLVGVCGIPLTQESLAFLLGIFSCCRFSLSLSASMPPARSVSFLLVQVTLGLSLCIFSSFPPPLSPLAVSVRVHLSVVLSLSVAVQLARSLSLSLSLVLPPSSLHTLLAHCQAHGRVVRAQQLKALGS